MLGIYQRNEWSQSIRFCTRFVCKPKSISIVSSSLAEEQVIARPIFHYTILSVFILQLYLPICLYNYATFTSLINAIENPKVIIKEKRHIDRFFFNMPATIRELRP